MSFCIRAMQAQDLDGLVVFAEAPRWTRLDYERILLAEPSDPLLRCGLVALSGGALVGLAVASWLRQEAAAELEGLVVDREYRRRGIAGALVETCLHWAAKTGASAVRLEVRASNTAALALYRRYGFSAVGLRHAYYSAPVEDALLLQAPIPL